MLEVRRIPYAVIGGIAASLRGEPRVTADIDFVIMKLLAGRPRDEQDIRGIMMVHGERLDWDYCLRLAADLGQAVEQNLVSPLQKLREEFGSVL